MPVAGLVAVPVAAQVNPSKSNMVISSSFVPTMTWEVWGIRWRARVRKVRRKVIEEDPTAHRWKEVAGTFGGL